MEDTRFAVLNIVPMDANKPSHSTILYQLSTKSFEDYKLETSALLLVGISLIGIFAIILYKSLTSAQELYANPVPKEKYQAYLEF